MPCKTGVDLSDKLASDPETIGIVAGGASLGVDNVVAAADDDDDAGGEDKGDGSDALLPVTRLANRGELPTSMK